MKPNFLTSILRGLRNEGERSSADLRKDLTQIDLSALEGAVVQHEAQRRALLLTGTDSEIAAATAALSAANLECERAQAAAEELKKRITEAERREALAEIDRKAAEAQAARVSVLAAYRDLDGAAREVVRLLTAIHDGQATIRAANSAVAAAGRNDLKTSWPLSDLLQLTGASDAQLPDPLRWQLTGYWPSAPTYSGGSLIAAPLRSDWAFSRAGELLSAPARKAA